MISKSETNVKCENSAQTIFETALFEHFTQNDGFKWLQAPNVLNSERTLTSAPIVMQHGECRRNIA